MVIERSIGAGLLRFESFEAGEWLTTKGLPAKTAKRHYTLNGIELPSVSQIVATLAKPALYHWHEDMGARGAIRAVREGKIDAELVPDEEIIGCVRRAKLGAAAARDDSAGRGSAIHLVMHELATTGRAPRPLEHPPAWRPWIRGALKAWRYLDVEPDDVIASEFIVCDPAAGYAGRPDLYVRSRRRRILVDYKTGQGRVYDEAHLQTRGYAEACEASGYEPPDEIMILGIDPEGGFTPVAGAADASEWRALLSLYEGRRRRG